MDALPNYEDMDVPLALEPSVTRHRANLARLVGALCAAGVDDEQIETSVNAVVASYRGELLSAIRSIMKSHADV